MSERNQNLRIALYGGAFDPPHNGHLCTTSLLLNSGAIDKVWILPSGDRPDKTGMRSSFHRMAMTKAAFAEAFGERDDVIVSDLHLDPTCGGHGTIDLLDLCTDSYPSMKFYVVVGSELIKDLPKWRLAERLKQEARFLIVSRPGTSHEALPKGYNMTLIPNPNNIGVTIASTALREMINSHQNVQGLLPAAVARYIQEHQLYIPTEE